MQLPFIIQTSDSTFSSAMNFEDACRVMAGRIEVGEENLVLVEVNTFPAIGALSINRRGLSLVYGRVVDINRLSVSVIEDGCNTETLYAKCGFYTSYIS